MNRKLMALLAVALIAISGTAAAAGFGLNPTADVYPHTEFHEDRLTISSHDVASMDMLEYENDSGEIATIKAHVNGTEAGELVSYRADQLEDSEFGAFPRSGDENGNVSVLDASAWTASGANVSLTQTNGSTAEGVASIQMATDGSMTSSDTAYVSYTAASIDSDAEKRVLQLIGNVETLDAGAEVQVQIRDGDGDYVAPVINSSRDATADDVIANATANGVIYQVQLGQLSVKGSGDGKLNAIEEIRVVTEGGDATVTFTAINAEKKSLWDFGTTRVLDESTDADDDYKDKTVRQNADGGRIQVTSLSSLGEWSTDSIVHQLQYINVEYRMEDDPAAVSVEFTEAKNYPNFPAQLEISYRKTIPTAYDITHGQISLNTTQTFLSDRYTRFRYAEGVGDTETADVSEDTWVDLSGSLGEPEKEIQVDATVQPDSTYVFQLNALVLEDQKKALEQTGGAGGFWGGSSGANPLMSMYNWIAGGIVGLLSMIGIKLKLGN